MTVVGCRTAASKRATNSIKLAKHIVMSAYTKTNSIFHGFYGVNQRLYSRIMNLYHLMICGSLGGIIGTWDIENGLVCCVAQSTAKHVIPGELLRPAKYKISIVIIA